MIERIFLTADLHLSHNNVRRYCQRPFGSCKEMDETILNNWNEVVPENGEVYILGDVTFGSPGYTGPLLSGMKGKKYLIRGNHDKTSRIKKIEHCFEWIKDYHELIVQEHKKKHMVVLSHYAFRVWNKSHHGSYHAFGHSHGTLKVPETSLSMDVGVDCHNFYPVSLVKFIEEMERRRKLWVI